MLISDLMMSISIISAVSSTTIWIPFIFFPKLRSRPYMTVVFFIAVSDFFNALGSSVGLPPTGSVNCWFEGVVTNMFSLASVLWTVVVVIMMYTIVVHGKALPITKWHHLICWGLPIFVTFLPLMNVSYGLTNGWCWLIPTEQSPAWAMPVWRWINFYAIVWGGFVAIVIIFLALLYEIKVKVHKASKDVVKKVFAKLQLYPVVLVFCWLLTCISDLYLSTRSYGRKGDWTISLLTSILPCTQGFLTTVVFWWSNADVRTTILKGIATGNFGGSSYFTSMNALNESDANLWGSAKKLTSMAAQKIMAPINNLSYKSRSVANSQSQCDIPAAGKRSQNDASDVEAALQALGGGGADGGGRGGARRTVDSDDDPTKSFYADHAITADKLSLANSKLKSQKAGGVKSGSAASNSRNSRNSSNDSGGPAGTGTGTGTGTGLRSGSQSPNRRGGGNGAASGASSSISGWMQALLTSGDGEVEPQVDFLNSLEEGQGSGSGSGPYTEERDIESEPCGSGAKVREKPKPKPGKAGGRGEVYIAPMPVLYEVSSDRMSCSTGRVLGSSRAASSRALGAIDLDLGDEEQAWVREQLEMQSSSLSPTTPHSAVMSYSADPLSSRSVGPLSSRSGGPPTTDTAYKHHHEGSGRKVLPGDKDKDKEEGDDRSGASGGGSVNSSPGHETVLRPVVEYSKITHPALGREIAAVHCGPGKSIGISVGKGAGANENKSIEDEGNYGKKGGEEDDGDYNADEENDKKDEEEEEDEERSGFGRIISGYRFYM